MATFIQVRTSQKAVYRLNVDQIVSYTQNDARAGGTNITLATGGSIIVVIGPEKLDDLLQIAGSRVLTEDGSAI
jgi:hypothetical protein